MRVGAWGRWRVGAWGIAVAMGAALAAAPVAQRAAMPPITVPVLFDTPEADRILAGMQIFPPDNAWNEDISDRPVALDSARIIASIGPDKPLGYNLDMNFVIVPPAQPRVPVRVTMYPKESDPGPFPIPGNAPIENWPLAHNEDAGALPTPGVTLEAFQRHGTGDRHLIVVDPMNGRLHEFWQARLTDAGWEASQASTFDVTSNRQRPVGWTSSDAAGLAIFPAIARYDEVARGHVTHALRVTVRRTRRAYVYPASHFASPHTDPALPRMGERLRLRRDFDTSGFPPHARAIAEGLKRYGMIVADNGRDWLLSIAPDRRMLGLEALGRIRGADFEVIVPTGEHEGPRATHAPHALLRHVDLRHDRLLDVPVGVREEVLVPLHRRQSRRLEGHRDHLARLQRPRVAEGVAHHGVARLVVPVLLDLQPGDGRNLDVLEQEGGDDLFGGHLGVGLGDLHLCVASDGGHQFLCAGRAGCQNRCHSYRHDAQTLRHGRCSTRARPEAARRPRLSRVGRRRPL